MRIALVHDWLTGVRGGEKCLDVLCQAWPDASLFTLLHRRGATTDAIERMRIVTSNLQYIPGISKTYRYFLPLMPAAIESLRLPTGLDLAVSFSHAVAKGAKVPDGVPHVCYCFTPMRYAWHARDQYFNEASRAGREWLPARVMRKVRNRLLDELCDWDRKSSERITHFIAISRTVQQRIRECYNRDSVVIFPPVDVDFYCPAETVRNDQYLCVSALVPYKRIELAIQACNRLGRRLLIVGTGPMQNQLMRQAGPTVHFLGWRTNEEIRELLRCCRALIFPGIEDFGIVPVEAQACGCPVIAYGAGGATETVLPADESRPGTGLFFEEQTVECLCEAMLRYEGASPDSICSAAARRQALPFSTQRYQREMLAYINSVVGSSVAELQEQRQAVA